MSVVGVSFNLSNNEVLDDAFSKQIQDLAESLGGFLGRKEKFGRSMGFEFQFPNFEAGQEFIQAGRSEFRGERVSLRVVQE